MSRDKRSETVVLFALTPSLGFASGFLWDPALPLLLCQTLSLWTTRHLLSLEWTFKTNFGPARLWCTFQHHLRPRIDQHGQPLAQGRQHLPWHSLPAAFPRGACPWAWLLLSCIFELPLRAQGPCLVPCSHRAPRSPYVLRLLPNYIPICLTQQTTLSPRSRNFHGLASADGLLAS